MDRKRIIGFLFGIGVILLFALAVGLEKVITAFLSADPVLLSMGVFVMILSLIFRASVWYGLFVLSDVNVSFRKILSVYTVSLSAKLTIPVGYVALQTVIAYIISKDSYLDTERVLSVITLGDLINSISYYTIGLVALGLVLFRGNIPSTYESYTGVSLIILLFLIGSFLILWRYQENILNGVIWAGNKVEIYANSDSLIGRLIIFEVEGIEDKAVNAYDAIIMIFSDPKELFSVFMISHLSSITSVAIFAFCGMALDIGFSFSIAVLIVVLSKFGAFIPTPGGLGGVESIIIASTILLTGASIVEATTLVLLYRLISYWMIVIGGGALSSLVSYNIDT